MSKLEEQKALPRRKLYRTRDLAAGFAAGRIVGVVLDETPQIAKPKRKAKKAKGKR
jgi:hypothetical protein